ncbi:PadR family transcriptional regulator [Myceligenerans pegani]|uniref:PadR family transcriptional regulator n=1 Tax=Myceligenerans pegani TaxID=2776917 RepID=A0ABR9MW20_9MICO|nr:PadR family transcriptional regulator [Myceligenerans sp. TRM 65318]MBE1875578.1 PadR family transcriptional regulator [Myceligenerans sp. TRM 65318]MBE3017849.1 PadR family transcriptional regulator [Myceligenerans sp. TRM 65318]
MTEERIATNLRKGVLEYCVLALLSHGEKYGLELAGELIARELIASEGSLYPLLARMRENGLVEPRWDSSGTGRPRRYYAITDHGTEQLTTFTRVWTSLGAQVDDLLEGSR